MAVSEPLDLLTGFPGWSTTFELGWRQEQSRHASGRTRVKDFGSPLWQAQYQSRSLSRQQLSYWRARLDAAENGLVTFTAYDMGRCRPMAHQGAGALPTGELHTIDDNDKAVRVDDLTGITLSVGDMIQIGAGLYRVQEAAVAVAGLTPLFEVRPHLWVGTTVGDDVVIERPSCLMTIVPGSIKTSSEMNGRGSVSWQAIEARG